MIRCIVVVFCFSVLGCSWVRTYGLAYSQITTTSVSRTRSQINKTILSWSSLYDVCLYLISTPISCATEYGTHQIGFFFRKSLSHTHTICILISLSGNCTHNRTIIEEKEEEAGKKLEQPTEIKNTEPITYTLNVLCAYLHILQMAKLFLFLLV